MSGSKQSRCLEASRVDVEKQAESMSKARRVAKKQSRKQAESEKKQSRKQAKSKKQVNRTARLSPPPQSLASSAMQHRSILPTLCPARDFGKGHLCMNQTSQSPNLSRPNTTNNWGKGGFVYLSLNGSCSYPDVEVRVGHAMGCCSGDRVHLVERFVNVPARAAQALAAVLLDVLDALEEEPTHLHAHGLRVFLATRVDFLSGPRLVSVVRADRVGVSSEERVVVQGRHGGEDVSDGVIAEVVRRPHDDWRVELLTNGDEDP